MNDRKPMSLQEAVKSENSFAISQIVAATALDMLVGFKGLAHTVHRDAEEDFRGGVGTKVRIRRPEVLKAGNFNGSVNSMVQPVKDTTIELEITDHALSAVEITDKEMRFDLYTFEQQITLPQSAGVGDYLEENIAKTMNQRTAEGAPGLITMKADQPRHAIIDAGTVLDKSRTAGRRWLAVSPDVKNALLKDDNFSQVAQAGSDETLRGGIIGEAYGFTVVYSPFLADKTAVAYVGSAFAMAVCSPPVVRSEFSASAGHQGYSMRWLMTFNDDSLNQRSIMDAYVGSTVLDERRSVGIKLA
ncbi:P22 phage major capsid protein family protein [Streptomyces chrestomyceticus]|uniref:P22 phage major capsid protein family protein n=1 Tax=Streptomyces chrestomyceticus TaxID=68185 RepID=UPI0034103A55